MDTNWCIVCGRHTAGDLYCSTTCAQADGVGQGPTFEQVLLNSNSNTDDSGCAAATSTGFDSEASSAASSWSWLSAMSPPPPSSSSQPQQQQQQQQPAGRADAWANQSQCAPRQSPQLLAEIRYRSLGSLYRDLPRRRGLPFYQELRADYMYGILRQPKPRHRSSTDTSVFPLDEATLCK